MTSSFNTFFLHLNWVTNWMLKTTWSGVWYLMRKKMYYSDWLLHTRMKSGGWRGGFESKKYQKIKPFWRQNSLNWIMCTDTCTERPEMCITKVHFDFMLTFQYYTVNGIPEKSYTHVRQQDIYERQRHLESIAFLFKHHILGTNTW